MTVAQSRAVCNGNSPRHKKRKKATPAKTPKFINPMIYFICDDWKRGLRYWECLTH